MELRLYCDKCGKELGFFPQVEDGQMSFSVLIHVCDDTAQPSVQQTELEACAKCGRVVRVISGMRQE